MNIFYREWSVNFTISFLQKKTLRHALLIPNQSCSEIIFKLGHLIVAILVKKGIRKIYEKLRKIEKSGQRFDVEIFATSNWAVSLCGDKKYDVRSCRDLI